MSLDHFRGKLYALRELAKVASPADGQPSDPERVDPSVGDSDVRPIGAEVLEGADLPLRLQPESLVARFERRLIQDRERSQIQRANSIGNSAGVPREAVLAERLDDIGPIPTRSA
jgi:hypothetical protein